MSDHHSYWCEKRVNLGRGQQIPDGQRAKKRSHQSQNPASGRQHRENQERPWRQVQQVGKIFCKYTTQLVRGRNFLYNSQCFDTRLCFFFFNITFNILVPGVAKLMKTYSGNPAFSNQKNLEETEQQLDEVKSGVCSWSIWLHLTLIAALFNDVVLPLVVFSQAGSPRGHSLQALGSPGWIKRDNNQVLSPFQGQHCEMER